MTRFFYIFTVVLLCSPCVLLASLPALYDSSAADANPSTQGWTASEVLIGTDSSPIDGLIDAGANVGPVEDAPEASVVWQINDQLGSGSLNLPSYRITLSTAEQDALIAASWTLTARVKAVLNDSTTNAGYIGWGLSTSAAVNTSGQNRRAGFYFRVGDNNSFEIFDDRGLLDTSLRINLGPNSADEYHTVVLQSNGPGSTLFSWTVDGNPGASDVDILQIPFGINGAFLWSSNSSSNMGVMNVHTLSLLRSVLRVDADATGANNGSTWGDAFPNLQDALAIAVPGQQVWVAEGTYHPDQGSGQTPGDRTATFQLLNGVEIYGGFDGTETELSQRDSDPTTNGTTLSGDLAGDDGSNFINYSENSYHVLSGSGADATALLDGFTITAGNADGTSPENFGGGMILIGAGSSPTLSYCRFLANRATSQGGAVYSSGGSPLFSNCVFESNTSAAQGGAMVNQNASPALVNCIFSGNTAGTDGAAVNNSNATPEFINCLFSGNAAGGFGGAISNYSNSAPVFTNCTFQGNAAGSSGGAIRSNGGSVSLKNSIIWQNAAASNTTTASASIALSTATATYAHSLVENLDLSAIGMSNFDGTDPNNDPFFVMETNPLSSPSTSGDLRLQPISPAIGAGDNSANTEALDLAGKPRLGPLDDTIELGAYESQNISLPDLSDVNATAPIGNEFVVSGWMPDSSAFNNGNGFNATFTITGSTGDIAFDTAPAIDPDGTLRFTLTNRTSGSIDLDVVVSDPSGDFAPSVSQSITISAPKIIRYVDASATGSNDGSSWSHAFTDLQDALAVAISGEDIWVAQGTYKPTTSSGRSSSFLLIDGVGIYGGFPAGGGTFANRDSHPTTNATFLSGDIGVIGDNTDNSYHVVRVNGSNNTAIIDGFTITGGNANGSSLSAYGGGFFCIDGGSPTLRNIAFLDNSSSSRGGALYAESSQLRLTNTIFAGNSSPIGGAIYSNEGSLRITHGIFSGNTASFQGGALRTVSETTITNSVFSQNASDSGGAIYISGSSSTTITNTIIWNNTSNGDSTSSFASIRNVSATSTINIYRSLIANSGSSDDWDFNIGTDLGYNLDTDPLFVDADGADDIAGTIDDDLRLTSTSPAINAGNNSANTEMLDLDGNPRLVPLAVDLGPYESSVFGIALFIARGDTGASTSISDWAADTTAFNNGDGFDYAFNLVSSDGSIAFDALPTVAPDGTLNFAIATGTSGIATFEVTVSDPTGFYPTTTAIPVTFRSNNLVLHVDSTATGSGNGLSWANAFTNLQDAIAAADPGDSIWVAEGTYRPDEGTLQTLGDRAASFELAQDMAIYGGFPNGGGDGSFAARNSDPATNGTVLSGDLAGDDGADFVNISENSLQVLTTADTASSVILDGFTVSGGNANLNIASRGAGLYSINSHPTVANVLFKNNSASNEGGALYLSDGATISDGVFMNNRSSGIRDGGAIYNRGDLTILRSTFSANSSRGDGGAIYSVLDTDETLAISQSTFEDNTTRNSGGAVYSAGGELVITNTIFNGNRCENSGTSSGNGGALYTSSLSTLTNISFSGNTAANGGAARIQGETTLTNASFTNNSATSEGGALYLFSGSSRPIEVINSIVWENSSKGDSNTTSSSIFNVNASSYTVFKNSLIANSGGSSNWNSLLGMDAGNNIDANPLFIDADGVDDIAGTLDDNLRLASSSPAINAGDTNANSESLDLDGNVRLVPLQIDMGPYESNVFGASLANTIAAPGSAVMQNAWAPDGTNFNGGSGFEYNFTLTSSTGNMTFDALPTVTPDGTLNFTLFAGSTGFAFFEVVISDPGGVYPDTPPASFVIRSSEPLVLHVDQAATGAGHGVSWADAFITLQDALAVALPGDEIWVAAGTYKPDQGGQQISGSRSAAFQMRSNLAIYGGFPTGGGDGSFSARNPDPVTNGTLLSGDLNGNDGADFAEYEDNSLHILIAQDTDSTAILDGFSIRGGNADGFSLDRSGGGLLNLNATPTLTNLAFLANSATSGGAISVSGTNGLNIENCTFELNRASLRGGAISSAGSDNVLNIINSSFTGNTANFIVQSSTSGGGALYNGNGSVTISESEFIANESPSGGAVYNTSGTLIATHTTFDANSASNGGALYNTNGSPELTNVTFIDNNSINGGAVYSFGSSSRPRITQAYFYRNSASSGGAVYITSGSSAEITNTAFIGNIATGVGGALFNQGSSTFTNCTFTENSAQNLGGAVYNTSRSPEFINSIIWNNRIAGDHINLAASVYSTSINIAPTFQHCIVANSGGSRFWHPLLGTDLGNNLDIDPLFLDPDGADDLIGTVDDNVRLAALSPARNYGINSANTEAFDLDGNPRLVPAQIDLGPYESDTFGAAFADTNAAAGSPASIASWAADSSAYNSGAGFDYTFNLVGSAGSITFAALPSVTADGTLSFTITSGTAGFADFEVTLSDPGGLYPPTSPKTFTIRSADPMTLYVDATASGLQTGIDWSTAFTHLQDALAVALPDDQIWVAAGTYRPDEGSVQTAGNRYAAFHLRSNLALYGGFSGTETLLSQRNSDPTTNGTILSGDLLGDDGSTFANYEENSLHVLTAIGVDATARVDGFTVTGGYADGAFYFATGGGLYISGGSPTITNLSFIRNYATSQGGGLYISRGSPTITNLSFIRNYAPSQGGALYSVGDPSIGDSLFIENQTDSRGGACFFAGGNPTISRTTFSGNYGIQGGAIYNQSSGLSIENTTFNQNSASTAGAFYNNNSSSPSITNTSFTGNFAEFDGGAFYNASFGSSTSNVLTNVVFSGNAAGRNGGAIYNCFSSMALVNASLIGNRAALEGGALYNERFGADPTLTNTIIWGNAVGDDTSDPSASVYNGSGANPSFSHGLVEHSGGSGSWNTSLGNDLGNNLDVNPLIVLPPNPLAAPTLNGDLRLQSGSPAIDTGDATANAEPLDLDGTTRIQGIAIDLGAYEGSSSPLDFAFYFPGLDPDADANENGISNYLEFAAGFDPTAYISPSEVNPQIDSEFKLTFKQRNNASNLLITWEKSDSLTSDSWSPLILNTDYIIESVTTEGARDIFTIQLLADPAVDQAMFYRQSFE